MNERIKEKMSGTIWETFHKPDWFRPVTLLLNSVGFLSVVYFHQRFGAGHSKGWSKYAISMFVMPKSWIKGKWRKLSQNWAKNAFFKFAPCSLQF